MERAGAVLKTTVVVNGWKFPRAVLIDGDERHLFDVEVKMKSNHFSSLELLKDYLIDFPPHIFLSRVGILEAVLDIIGCKLSLREQGFSIEHGCRQPPLIADIQGICSPFGVDQLACVDLMTLMVQRSVNSFQAQLEGHNCSYNSESTSPGDNLGANLARAMFAMRHPLLPNVINDHNSSRHGNEIMQEFAEDLVLLPSVPGLSFACCAAALPLFQTRDLQTCCRVLNLFTYALPFVCEPFGDAALSFDRLQHLANRLEQVLRFYTAAPSLLQIITQHHHANTEQVKPAHDLVMETSVDLTIIALLATILSAIQKFEDSVRASKERSSPATLDKLNNNNNNNINKLSNNSLCDYQVKCGVKLEKVVEIGPLSLNLLQDVIISCDHFQYYANGWCAAKDLPDLRSLLKDRRSFTFETISRCQILADNLVHLREGLLTSFRTEKCDQDKRDNKCIIAPSLYAAVSSSSHLLYNDMSDIKHPLKPTLAGLIALIFCCEGSARTIELIDHKDSTGQMQSPFELLLSVISNGCNESRADVFDALLNLLFMRHNKQTTSLPLKHKHLFDLMKDLDISSTFIDSMVILDKLSNPVLILILMLSVVLQSVNSDSAENSDEKVAEAHGQLFSESDRSESSAMVLLDAICTHVVKRSLVPAAEEAQGHILITQWCALLCPLKLLTWRLNDSKSQPSLGIDALAQRLEEVASSSYIRECQDCYGRMLVMGLFHRCDVTRIHAYLKITHELLGMALPSADLLHAIRSSSCPLPVTAVNAQSNFTVKWKQNDPFYCSTDDEPKKLSLMLVDLPEAPTAGMVIANSAAAARKLERQPKSNQFTKSVFTHSDIRKLAQIARGTQHDDIIRTSALRQMRDMLCDAHLVCTFDPAWSIDLCNGLLSQISSLEPCISRTGACSAVVITGTTNARLRLLAEVALLLKLLISKSSVVRDHIVILPKNAALPLSVETKDTTVSVGSINMWPLVSLFTKCNDLSPSDKFTMVEDFSSETPRYLFEIKLCITQVLAMVVHCTKSWITTEQDVSGLGNFTTVRICPGGSALQSFNLMPIEVPQFVSKEFMTVSCPQLVSSSRVQYDGECGIDDESLLCPVSVRFVGIEMILKCCEDKCYKTGMDEAEHIILTQVLQSRSCSSLDWHRHMAAALCVQLKAASSHSSLRLAITAFESHILALPCFANCLLQYCQDELLEGLSKVLTTLPRTVKDVETLKTVLSFITNIISQHKKDLADDANVNFAQKILRFICKALLPLLDTDEFNESVQLWLAASAHSAELEANQIVRNVQLLVNESLLSLIQAIFVLNSRAAPQMRFHLDSDRGLALLPQLCAMTRHLVATACHEGLPTHLRALATNSLEQMLKSSNAFSLLVCDPRSTMDSDDDEGDEVDEIANHSGHNYLNELVRSIKLLRTPDSLRCSAVISNMLRVLLLALQHLRQNTVMRDWVVKNDWQWLLRMSFDRRNVIKLVSLKILQECLSAGWTECPQTRPSCKQVLNNNNSTRAAVEPDQVVMSLKQLIHLVKDTSESPAVRLTVIQILSLPPVKSSSSVNLDDVEFGQLVAGAVGCICCENFTSTTYSLHLAMKSLLNIAVNHPLRRVLFFELLRSLKVVPKVVQLLHKQLTVQMQSFAWQRVGHYDKTFNEPYNEFGFASDDIMLLVNPPDDGAISGCNEAREEKVLCSGWIPCGSTWLGEEQSLQLLLRSEACRFLQFVAEIKPEIMAQCVQNTAVMQCCLYWAVRLDAACATPACNGMDAACSMTNALTDLLSTMFQMNTCGGKSTNSPASMLSRVAYQNPVLPLHLLQSLISAIKAEIRKSRQHRIALPNSMLNLLTSIGRLLVLMLNEPMWRGALALGGPYVSSTLNEAVREGAMTLMSVRLLLQQQQVRVSNCNQQKTIARVGVQLDFVISLLLKHSHSVKEMACCQDVALDMLTAAAVSAPSSSTSSPHTLLQHHCAVIKQAPVMLKQMVGRQDAGVIKHALQSLKSKQGSPAAMGKERQQKTPPSALAARKLPGSRAASHRTSPAVNVSPPASSENDPEDLPKYSSKPKNNSNPWRAATRGFSVTVVHKSDCRPSAVQSSTSSSIISASSPSLVLPGSSLHDDIPGARVQLLCSLVYVSSAMLHSAQAQGVVCHLGMQESVVELMYLVKQMATAGGLTGPPTVALKGAKLTKPHQHHLVWSPSDEQLATAIMTLAAAFIHNSPANKSRLCSGLSSDNRRGITHFQVATPDRGRERGGGGGGADGSEGSSSLLHYLWSLGLSKACPLPLRSMCLSVLCGVLHNTTDSLAFSRQKVAMLGMMNVCVQKQLHAVTPDLEVLHYMVEALTGCLAAECHLSALGEMGTTASYPSSHYNYHNSADMSAIVTVDANGHKQTDYKPLSLPVLISWVLHSSAGSSAPVQASVARLIGRIGAYSAGGPTLCAKQRLSASVLAEECLDMLLKGLHGSCAAVRAVCMLSIWAVTHNSEQTKASIRAVAKEKKHLALKVTQDERGNDCMPSTMSTSNHDAIAIDDLSRRATCALEFILQ